MKNIKRIVAMLLCVFMLTSAVGCKPQPKLTISDETLTMSLFDEKTITVETDIVGDIVWTNSDNAVVKLTGNGESANLIAVGAGSSTVTATVGEKSVTCAVTVAQTTDKLVLDVTSSKAIVATVGSTSDIVSAVTFKDAAFTKASVAYAVTAEPAGCVTVNNSGVITAVATGTATVTAKASYMGHDSNEVSIAVTVVDLALDLSEVKLVVGSDDYVSEVEVVANYVVGETTTAAEVAEYDVIDANVATFEDGKIKALAVGSTIMTLTFAYNNDVSFNKQVSITVANPPVVALAGPAEAITVDMRDLRGDVDAVVFEDNATLSVGVTVDEVAVEEPEITYSVKEGSEGIISVKGNVVTGLAKGAGVVVASYTDDFGKEHTTDINVNVNGNIFYGQHEKYPVDGVVAHVTALSGFVMEGVSLTEEVDEPLIRLQYIPTATYTGAWEDSRNSVETDLAAPGPQLLLITIVDSENKDNFITVGVRQGYDNYGNGNHISRIGARVGAWGEYVANLGTAGDFYAGSSGWMGVGGNYAKGFFFSLYGTYLNEENHQCAESCYYCGREYTGINYVENYERYMLQISVVGTKVYYYEISTDNGDGTYGDWYELVDLANLPSTAYAAWDGFESDKVNIMVTATNPTANQPDDCSIMVDTLGGEKLTAVTDNMYFCRNWNTNTLAETYPKGWQPEA